MAVVPLIIDLAAVNAKPGDTITVSSQGDLSFSCLTSANCSPEVTVNLCGVFSTSNLIGAGEHREPRRRRSNAGFHSSTQLHYPAELVWRRADRA